MPSGEHNRDTLVTRLRRRAAIADSALGSLLEEAAAEIDTLNNHLAIEEHWSEVIENRLQAIDTAAADYFKMPPKEQRSDHMYLGEAAEMLPEEVLRLKAELENAQR